MCNAPMEAVPNSPPPPPPAPAVEDEFPTSTDAPFTHAELEHAIRWFGSFQETRVANIKGCIQETPPKGGAQAVALFLRDVRGRLGPKNMHRLGEAVLRFTEDPWARSTRKPPCPFDFFRAQWDHYLAPDGARPRLTRVTDELLRSQQFSPNPTGLFYRDANGGNGF